MTRFQHNEVQPSQHESTITTSPQTNTGNSQLSEYAMPTSFGRTASSNNIQGQALRTPQTTQQTYETPTTTTTTTNPTASTYSNPNNYNTASNFNQSQNWNQQGQGQNQYWRQMEERRLMQQEMLQESLYLGATSGAYGYGYGYGADNYNYGNSNYINPNYGATAGYDYSTPVSDPAYYAGQGDPAYYAGQGGNPAFYQGGRQFAGGDPRYGSTAYAAGSSGDGIYVAPGSAQYDAMGNPIGGADGGNFAGGAPAYTDNGGNGAVYRQPYVRDANLAPPNPANYEQTAPAPNDAGAAQYGQPPRIPTDAGAAQPVPPPTDASAMQAPLQQPVDQSAPQGDRQGRRQLDARNNSAGWTQYDFDVYNHLKEAAKALCGHSIQDYDKSVPVRLGCARAVSLLVNTGYGFPIKDQSIANLEKTLRGNGFTEVAIKDMKPGDVICGYRAKGDYPHGAVYMGNGQIFNNDSNDGVMEIQSIAKYNHSDFKRFVILRRPATVPAVSDSGPAVAQGQSTDNGAAQDQGQGRRHYRRNQQQADASVSYDSNAAS